MRESWRFLFSACSSSQKLVKVSHSTHVLYNFVMSAQWRQIGMKISQNPLVSKINRTIHAYYLRARILEYVASCLLTNCKHYLELCSSGIQAANVLMLKMSFV